MIRLWFILLLTLFSCSQSEEYVKEIDSFKINLDSLFLSADATIEQVNKEKQQKVLLEQDLWRKKRDIKKIKKKYSDSIYELNNLKLISPDSLVFDYKIVMKEVVDTVRFTITDSVCGVCQARQVKKEKRFYNKAFKWIKSIEL